MSPRQLEFTLTRQDFGAYTVHVVNPPNLRLARIMALILILVLFSLAIAVAASMGGQETVGPFVLGTGVGIWIAIGVARWKSQRLKPAPDGVVLGDRVLTLDDDGIQMSTRLSHTMYNWEAVQSVDVTPKHIYIMLDRIAGIIVPRRVFGSEREFEDFMTEVNQRSQT